VFYLVEPNRGGQNPWYKIPELPELELPKPEPGIPDYNFDSNNKNQI